LILTLFIAICLIALVMIVIGLTKPLESAQALIGFVFLFLLSIIIIGGNLEYEKGVNTNSSYAYDSYNRVNYTSQIVVYDYTKFNDTTSKQIGYYLAIASIVGFVGVILSLKRVSSPNE
jgi:hypothetical protein